METAGFHRTTFGETIEDPFRLMGVADAEGNRKALRAPILVGGRIGTRKPTVT